MYSYFNATALFLVVGHLCLLLYALSRFGVASGTVLAMGVFITCLCVMGWVIAALVVPGRNLEVVERGKLLVLRGVFGSYLDSVCFFASPQSDYSAWERKGCRMCMVPAALFQASGEGAATAGVLGSACPIAHELGHLLTADAARFQRATALFALAISATIGIFALVFVTHVELVPRAVVVLTVIAGVEVALFLRLMRVREYFADAVGGYLIGNVAMAAWLGELARWEPHLKYSWRYRLWHPTFSSRLERIGRPEVLLAYGNREAALQGAQLGLLAMAFSWGGNALLYFVGPTLWLVLVPSTLFYTWWAMARATIVGGIANHLTIRDGMLRGAIAGVTMLLMSLAVAGMIRAEFPIPQLIGDPKWRGIIERMWTQGWIWVGLLALYHAAWAGGAREMIRYRGPKRPTEGFIIAGSVILGLLGACVGLCAASVVLLPYALVSQPGNVAGNVAIAVGIITLAGCGAAVCAIIWKWVVRTQSVKWGGSDVRGEPQYVEAEWEEAKRIESSEWKPESPGSALSEPASVTTTSVVTLEQEPGPLQEESGGAAPRAAILSKPRSSTEIASQKVTFGAVLRSSLGYATVGGIGQGIFGQDVLMGVFAGLVAGVIVSFVTRRARG